MASFPVLDADTQALIAQLVADSFDYFANGPPTTTWDPSLGPSQIGVCYQDYEEPLSSYERELLEGPVNADSDEGWTVPDVRTIILYPRDLLQAFAGFKTPKTFLLHSSLSGHFRLKPLFECGGIPLTSSNCRQRCSHHKLQSAWALMNAGIRMQGMRSTNKIGPWLSNIKR